MATNTLPDTFFQQLVAKYETAKGDHHILFNGESAVHELISVPTGSSTINYQITLLKSLMHRPDQGSKDKNPFANPEPELTILANYKDEFKIVFNKYPVVDYHFMLVTNEFRPQSSPLTPLELSATYEVLQALKTQDTGRDWVGFYNSGDESGASQPHKHIQFMSLPSDFVPYSKSLCDSYTEEGYIPINTIVERYPLQDGNIPFAHFLAKFPTDIDEEGLALSFAALLQRTLTVLRENQATSISYNFIMTTEYMMMIPRRSSKYKQIGINSCGVLGLILCKNEELLDLVKSDGCLEVTKGVCFENTSGKAETDYDY
ncbi:APA2 [[Candida] subhashii]|uniref:APA2 n=1 Tax=[Candida] subhashii TaxID=561895 RepID=A0A8J5QBA7_9ASCO|nr:APA2 [[Candida] subhashii]KAG7662121.1 APA2 [[Candida] subhashii]